MFFFGRFFEFFNKQTPRHFLAVFYTRSRTTHKKHSEKKKKKKKREKEKEKEKEREDAPSPIANVVCCIVPYINNK